MRIKYMEKIKGVLFVVMAVVVMTVTSGCSGLLNYVGVDAAITNLNAKQVKFVELDKTKAYISFVRLEDGLSLIWKGSIIYKYNKNEAAPIGYVLTDKSKTMIPVEPGKHNFVISSCSVASIEVDAQAGRIYYIERAKAKKPSFWSYCRGQSKMQALDMTPETKKIVETLPIVIIDSEDIAKAKKHADAENFDKKVNDFYKNIDEVRADLRFVMTADKGIAFE